MCLVGQFYISAEVFASVVVMMCVAAVIAGIAAYFKRIKLNGRRFVQMSLVAVFVFVVCAGLGRGRHWPDPSTSSAPPNLQSVFAGYSSDPLGGVTATENQHFTLGEAKVGDSPGSRPKLALACDLPCSIGGRDLRGRDLALVLVVGVIVLRRRRVVQWGVLLAVAALVLSMGSRLHVDGHLTSTPLPFAILAHLPLLQSSVAARYVNY